MENGNGNLGDERGLVFGCGVGEEKSRGRWVLPRFFISLSSKEKEEDFLVMKGCKLPQRPKKRAKFIQKTILVRFFSLSLSLSLSLIYHLGCFPSHGYLLVGGNLQLVSPGSGLSDVSHERYEVREKKSSRRVSPKSAHLCLLSSWSSLFHSFNFLCTKSLSHSITESLT